MGEAIYGIDRPQPRTISTVTSFPETAARLLSPHSSRRHAYDGDSDSDSVLRHPLRRPVRSPVRPHRRMRVCIGPACEQEEEAGCPEAMELAGPPADGTIEERMTIVDSVASKSIIDCHQAEEFVSQDVVVGSVIMSAPAHTPSVIC